MSVRIKLRGNTTAEKDAFDKAVALIQQDPRCIHTAGRMFFFAATAESTSEGVSLAEITFFSGKLMLSGLHVIDGQRGKGYGTATLKLILDAADAAGIVVQLAPQPFGEEQRLNKLALTEWYRRHGFVPRTGGYDETMIRRVGRSKGVSRNEAVRLANKYGGNARPFEADKDGEWLSFGVTSDLIVPQPGTDAWWAYRQNFIHDLLLAQERAEQRDQ